MPFSVGHLPLVGDIFTSRRHCTDPCLVAESSDSRIPVWPIDISAILYGRISNPDWKVPLFDTHNLTLRFEITPSFAFGRLEPMTTLDLLTTAYKCLADQKVEGSPKRAENAIHSIVKSHFGPGFINMLPIGIAAPLREAARTCQLFPPSDWSLVAYQAIGRNDLAASARDAPDMLFSDGYRTVKDYIVCRPFPFHTDVLLTTELLEPSAASPIIQQPNF
jgi:anaphase-promoting complex subunit 1